MTLNQALVFLEIARRDGVENLEVRKRTGFGSAVFTNIIAILSPKGRDKKEGYDLVVQSDNFDDGRAKNLSLTLFGKKIIDKIVTKIND